VTKPPKPDEPRSWRTSFGRLRRAITWATPGQLDAGFASLATFITGLAAIRELGTSGLAAYALLISAYHVANQFPKQLIFSPSQVLAVDLPAKERLGALAHSVPRGAWMSAASALAVPLGALFVSGAVPRQDLIALSLTAALLAVVSPIQDHVRAVLHMSRASWMAAAMSATNLAGTGLLLAVMYSSISWAVFGSLFVGNCLSLGVGAVWIARRRTPPPPRPSMQHLRWLGGWLLASGLSKTMIRYGVNVLLTIFVGIVGLGFIQAARVVAQPVNVFSQGVMAQVGPYLTEAASRRNAVAARRWSRRFVALLGMVAVPYLMLVATPWWLNPFAALAPRAYEVPGLVAATVLVVAASAYMRSLRLQLLGARLQKIAARITILAGLVELALVSSGSVIGAYAAPFAAGAATVITILWFLRTLRQVYRRPDDPELI